jgi:alanyl-tRNA synthetase
VELGTEEKGYELGMQEGRIFSYGAKKNWWSRAGVPSKMPPGEPGGPDSEVFYDFSAIDPSIVHDPKFGAHCHPNCDCGRFIEVGNSVFMQFIKQADGTFAELPKKNVDFGGGLERLTAATRGNPDVFLIDVFDAARAALEAKSGKKYGSDITTTKSFRVILDHMRAASFMLASGINPGNTEQGYVLRRLIRRSIREADKLGVQEALLPDVAEGYARVYADAYPFIGTAAQRITDELAKEEAQFRKTLVNGMREFEKFAVDGTLSADDAFTLFTTFGFPVEMSEELAQERGFKVDRDAITKRMEEHQKQSRAGAAQKFAGGLADHAEQTVRYHTTHHILLGALQKVLGDDVHQRGSNITSERLRIDFSFGRKMTPEEISQVEKIVDELIWQDLPVTRTVMPRAEAEKLGAEMEFGATYPDMVSVYSVGPAHATSDAPDIPNAFSLEFCGGPHVTNTRQIHEGDMHFKILKEEASSAGVRRIKAVMK